MDSMVNYRAIHQVRLSGASFLRLLCFRLSGHVAGWNRALSKNCNPPQAVLQAAGEALTP